jgi:hypothetical protein
MTKTTPAPRSTDPRVLQLAQALALPRRIAWAVAAEAWEWMLAVERGSVVEGSPELLDVVIDVPGIGAALVSVGLVIKDGANGIMLPADIRDCNARQARHPDDRLERRKAQHADASRAYRRSKRLSAPQIAPAPAAANGGAAKKLGIVCGLGVWLLPGPYGAFIEVKGAEPRLKGKWKFPEPPTFAEALKELIVIRGPEEKKRHAGWDRSKWETVAPLVQDLKNALAAATIPARGAAAEAVASSTVIIRQHDADDASSFRHHPVIIETGENRSNSHTGKALAADDASSFASSSALSSSSSSSELQSNEEEEGGKGGIEVSSIEQARHPPPTPAAAPDVDAGGESGRGAHERAPAEDAPVKRKAAPWAGASPDPEGDPVLKALRARVEEQIGIKREGGP